MIINHKISLVIPIMNEEHNIKPLLIKIKEALREENYQVIFVDDGSTDRTVSNIKKFADSRVKTIVFNKNYGQTTAMAAGIKESDGEYIVTLDGDLQNDPTDIPAMIEKLKRDDVDVVAGFRVKRHDNTFFKKIPSKIANILIRKSTGIYLHDYGCTLKVFKSEIAKNLGLYGELHRFIPVLAKMQGAKLTEMPVKHQARLHGVSKYGINRTFKVMSDLMLMIFFQKYLQRPMHLFGVTGLIIFLLGSFVSLYLLIIKLLGEDIWGRPLLILGITMLIGGIQLITIGILAEVIVRTYFESQDKKTYRIKEIFVGS